MEQKQLNFDVPLLSVRRNPSKLGSPNAQNGAKFEKSMADRRNTFPSHKTDLNLDQVTKPVAVPFMWEHIPGRAKSKSGPIYLSHEEPSASPSLPPGRVLDRQHLKKEFEGENVIKPQASFPINSVAELESTETSKDEKGGSDLEDNDAYSDAPETLSPTASFSFSCSVSGLNGYDGLDVKPSGNFSTDPEIRDFMLSRFLPAAKAMALEPPQYISRNQPVMAEQLPEVKKIVTEKRPLFNQCESSIVPYIGQEIEEDETESEDETFESTDNISGRGCGLLPQICLKNSFCLLNPAPGIKNRSQSPRVSAGEVRRLIQTASIRPRSQPLNKYVSEDSKRKNLDPKVHSHMHEWKNKQTDELFSHSSGSQEVSAISSHRLSGHGNISPYRNQRPPSPFCQGVGFLGTPRETENLKIIMSGSSNNGSNKVQEVLPQKIIERKPGTASLAIEKTLYIDSVHGAKSSHSNSDGKLQTPDMKKKIHTADENPKIFLDSAYTDCTSQDSKSLSTRETGLNQEFKTAECLKVSANRHPNIDIEQNLKANDSEKSDLSIIQSPFFPPLPKTPSDSWLWRALPSIPSRYPHSDSRKFPAKTSPAGTKWETIVKTSKLHLDHVRYSEELITHVPKQFKN